ncbi:MAG: ABC transporter ATP-binding protein [Lachnospiraceae bacterium]|nr:ABC transporter ATP-binding protein [Lachnospiraceae bacterium]
MVEVTNLTKSFGEKIVVNDTTWTAKDGNITGFIGHNGAGKTTTLKMLTGALKPTKGTVKLNGIDITKNHLEAKKQFGYVSDSPDHFLRLKGIEYINLMADIYEVPTEERVEKIKNISTRLGIYDALDNTILSYSHGMRQKVMIIGALIHEPSIWILDEPLLGLDPQSSYELKQMMKEHVSKGNSVIFSTHILEVADKLCDEVLIIKKGEMQFAGGVEELKAKYESDDLEKIFLNLNGIEV